MNINLPELRGSMHFHSDENWSSQIFLLCTGWNSPIVHYSIKSLFSVEFGESDPIYFDLLKFVASLFPIGHRSYLIAQSVDILLQIKINIVVVSTQEKGRQRTVFNSP